MIQKKKALIMKTIYVICSYMVSLKEDLRENIKHFQVLQKKLKPKLRPKLRLKLKKSHFLGKNP